MLPGSVKATLLLLLMLASQEVISQERGRQSSPARASQGDDDSPMSLKAKDDRTQDLLSQKTGREQVPLETPSDEPASRRGGMAGRRATKNTKRLSNRNPKKKEVEKKNKERQDPDRRKQSPGGKCGSSTRVGVGEVLAVEASDSGKAVECKHTIRARKGVTLKMTCPRFSLSPGGCKEEKVIIREVGKGKGFKKKYCKSENPGADVSVAAPKAVTFLHERTQQKGKRCSDGFLCLFSATEISGTVSECRKKYKLREGETMIVTPTTFRDKVSCKYSFRSPPGTVLSLRCPSFNLNARGCGRERVIVREKKPKYKEKFCKENNPAAKRGQTASNYVIITHKRKKLKNNECERGFWCQVSAVRGPPLTTDPPTSTQSPTPKQTLPQSTASTQSSTSTKTSKYTTSTETSSPPPTSTETSSPPPTSTETSTPPPASTETSSPPPTSTETSSPPPASTETSSPPPTSTETSSPPPTSTETSTPPPASTETSSPPPTSTETSTPPPTSTETSTPPPTSTETSTPPPTSTETSTPPPASTETSSPPPTSTETSTPPSTSTRTSTQPETSSSTTASTIQQRFFCESCGSVPSASSLRVVGGQDVSIGEYPWMALVYLRLGSGKVSICGASIIKSRWLLSASHCFHNVGYDLVAVFLGEHDITNNTEVPTTVGSVKRVVLHPEYDPNTYDNDVALIELEADVDFTPLIAPVCVATAEDTPDSGKAVVTGWGHTTFGGSISPVLQEAELDLIPIAACRDLFQQTTVTITDNMLCALTEGRDACQGDSGGPLVRQLSDGRWAQVGVVSFGIECAKPGRPGVFMRAHAYVDWVINVTASESC
ncbi:serine proteinase stubble-like isoform X1 [Penaeus japonicus]|uniref:serine proteinase stubble-like isoform X1 n=1 Tax=Penaeus japonicus TaxID=27405 RepID=UPI001C70E0D4|nr:serine proteinase stubble-like isoform X1 [Penaeus japonicus]